MCFPHIPIKCFQREFLLELGNLVVRAVKVDFIIIVVTGGRFVHVFMEIDLCKPLVLFVSVMGCLQAMEYEGLYQIRFGYGKFGLRQEVYPAVGSRLVAVS